MKAIIKIDLDRKIGAIDPKIYGQFMSRRPGVTDGGIYDPDNPLSDERGFRKDVFKAIKKLRPTIIRWPGGCTGTSYRWLDGVGPKEGRPRKIDLHFAWASNYGFGTDEFIEYCHFLNAEPLLVWNMGTGTLEEAASWLEYCNHEEGTYYSDLRVKYGHPESFKVRYWQLGNELSGLHELGYMPAETYAPVAREWAKILKRIDRSISIMTCDGQCSGAPLDWYYKVLPEVAPYIDYIAIHSYWHPRPRNVPDHAGFYYQFSGPYETERLIVQLGNLIEGIRNLRPSASVAGIKKDIKIAVTEWGARPGKARFTSPKDFLIIPEYTHPRDYPGGVKEPTFCLRDALTTATFLNALQRRCNIVKIATVAQTVNVNGLLNVSPRKMLKETIYWPFVMQVENSGNTALDTWVKCDSFAVPEKNLELPFLDVSTTLDETAKKLFISVVNRHFDKAIETNVKILEANIASEGNAHVLHHEDPQAMNTYEEPENVKPMESKTSGFSNDFNWTFQAHSYTILELNTVS